MAVKDLTERLVPEERIEGLSVLNGRDLMSEVADYMDWSRIEPLWKELTVPARLFYGKALGLLFWLHGKGELGNSVFIPPSP